MNIVGEERTHLTKDRLMETHTDWREFAGAHVEIKKDGRLIRTGFVKDVTIHGDVLWVEADGAERRALYERSQGYTVLPVSTLARADKP